MSLSEAKKTTVTEPIENGSPKRDQSWELSDLEDAQDTLAESPRFPDHESVDATLEPYPHFKAFYKYIFPNRDCIQKSTSSLEVAKEKVQPSDGQCRKCNLHGHIQMKMQEELKFLKNDMNVLKMKMEEQKELLIKVLDTFNEKWSKASAAFKGTFDILSHMANSSDAMADDVTMILVKQGQSIKQGDPGFKQYLKDCLNEYSVTKQDLDRIATTFCTLHNRLITENCASIKEQLSGHIPSLNKQMDELRKDFEKLASTVEGVKEIVSKENQQQLQTMDGHAPIMSRPNSSCMSYNRNSAPLNNSLNHLNSITIKREIVDDDIRFISKRKHNFRDQSIQIKPGSDYFLKKTVLPSSMKIEPMDVNEKAAGQQHMHQTDLRKDSVKVIIADVSKSQPHENSEFTNSKDKSITHDSPGDKVKIELKRQKIDTANSQPSTGTTVMNEMPLRSRNVNSIPSTSNDSSNVAIVQAKPVAADSNQICEQQLSKEDSIEKNHASVTSPVPHPKKYQKNNAQQRRGHKAKNSKENTPKVAPAKKKETFLIEDDDCVIVDEIVCDLHSSFSNNVSSAGNVKGKNAKPKSCNPPPTKTGRVPCYARGLIPPTKAVKTRSNNLQNVFDLIDDD